jgi:hypothetical protein
LSARRRSIHGGQTEISRQALEAATSPFLCQTVPRRGDETIARLATQGASDSWVLGLGFEQLETLFCFCINQRNRHLWQLIVLGLNFKNYKLPLSVHKVPVYFDCWC